MTVKDAMAAYFARRLATDPLVSADVEDVDPLLFVGPPDDDGWVEWKPQPRSEPFEVTEIERRAGATLHPSIKDYYNAFWFLDMGGKLRTGSAAGITQPVMPTARQSLHA